MSTSVHYLAIPPESDLYRCLQEEPACNAIMFHLLPYSHDLYHFFDIGEMEVEETIEDILSRYRSLLGEKPMLKIDAFFAELERTRTNYPGIEHRSAMLEKCDTDIQSRLTKILAKKHEDAASLAQKIVQGDGVLHPDLRQPGQTRQPWEDIIGLVSPPTVQEGAIILEKLKPRDLFPLHQNLDSWYRDNYRRWQKAYIAAAENNEALLIRIS
jgi:hypothetical protein